MRRTTRRPTVRTATLVAAGVLALGLAACGDDDPTMTDPAEDTTEDAGEGDDAGDGEAAEGETITMSFFNYDPEELTVPVGTTVTWVNDDGVRHTATADDGSFDVDTPEEGDEGSHTFDEAGEFPYVCEVHASMTATIIVE